MSVRNFHEWMQHVYTNFDKSDFYGDMVLDYLIDETTKLSGQARTVLHPERWPDVRDSLKEDVSRRLGIHHLPSRSPVLTYSSGVAEVQSYRIERVVLELAYGFTVPLLLYIPNRSGAFPAVLYSVGHWMLFSKAEDDIQRFCSSLAQMGFVVAVFDPIGQGERGPSFRDHSHRELLLIGITQLGLNVWEHQCVIDYLQSRPEVDSNRIGMTGASGGGLCTFFTSAIDERIQVAVPVCYVSSYTRFLTAVRGTNWDNVGDLCNQVPEIISLCDAAGLAALIAPRPLLMINGNSDQHFPVSGAVEVAEQAAYWFEVAGPERVMAIGVEEDHGYFQSMRELAYGWFAHWLQGRRPKDAMQEPKVEVFHQSATELQCFAGKTRSSAGAIDQLKQARLASLECSSLRQVQRHLITTFLGIDAHKFHLPTGTTVLSQTGWDGVKALAIEMVTEPGIRIPVFCMAPSSGRTADVVVYVSDNSDPSSSILHDWTLRCEMKGMTLVNAAPRGMGLTAPVPPPVTTVSTLEGPLEEVVPSPDDHLEFEIATDSLMLGRSLLGQQVFDILRIIEQLSTCSNWGAVTLVAEGPIASVIAYFTACLEPRIQTCVAKGMVVSLKCLAQEDDLTLPTELFLYDALNHFDFPDLVTLMQGKSIIFTEMVGGRGEVLDRETANPYWRQARHYIDCHGGSLQLAF